MDWTLERIAAHIADGLKLTGLFGFDVMAAGPERARLRINAGPQVLRPGGVVAGPILFAAADVATYALILARTGDADAVTVDLTINFLRGGRNLPLVAEATPLRAGRRLFSAAIAITEETGDGRLIAQATTNWALS
ncbi:MAG: PaaI family thioesterase [Proteobacteria bacterium]|nr:PaaI family thioesterase [Pseudomonadota bacterium]